MSYSIENKEGMLTILENGCIIKLAQGEIVYASEGNVQILNILYSQATSMWDAKKWVELGPDKVLIDEEKDHLKVRFIGFGGKDIVVDMDISVMEDEFIFEINVVNKEVGVVAGVVGPIISGFNELDGGTLYYPDRTGKKVAAPFNEFKKDIYKNSYPVPFTMQYFTYNTGKQGWAFYCLDEKMLYKKNCIGGQNNEAGTTQYCFCEGNTSKQLAPVMIKTYKGDWHKAADRYRSWFKSWSEEYRVSDKLKRLPIISEVLILSRPENDVSNNDAMKEMECRTFEKAQEEIRMLKEEGIEGIHVVGWHDQGHDTMFPEFNVSKMAGGKEKMKKMAVYASELGLQLGYYMNARLGCLNSMLYLNNRDWAITPADESCLLIGYGKRSGGATEQWGGETFDVLCPCAVGYIEQLKKRVLDLVTNYNADFIQFDQVGAGDGMLCFNSGHGHSTPAAAWAEGYMRMMKECIGSARKIKPDFWLWVEGNWDGIGQSVDLQQGGYMKTYPCEQRFYEIYRYTFPEFFLMQDAYLGGVPFWRGSPQTPAVAYLKKYEKFFAKSRFMDDTGLNFDLNNLEAKWHLADEELIIVVKCRDDKIWHGIITLDINEYFGDVFIKACKKLSSDIDIKVKYENGRLSFITKMYPCSIDGYYVQFQKNKQPESSPS